jgi:4-diphosphocytidyl-2-C-methyl-D-erythritol kinase
MSERLFLGLPAPAKLNLFLHITGRRPNGYHELQSLFVPISLADTLDFEWRDDGQIVRSGDVIGAPEHDLAVRAARLLREAAGVVAGAAIHVEKRIPAGAGMGGGSSDAATTLIALNRMWRLDWSREQLAPLALKLGADVPFFLGPGPAFVEGIGERVTPLPTEPSIYAVIFPQVSVSTVEIFSAPDLTRSTNPLTISAFSAARQQLSELASGSGPMLFGANDLQAVVRRKVPEVDAALKHLDRFSAARLTGSGSAVFAPMESAEHAEAAIAALPDGWQGFVVRSLAEHPLAAW